MAGDASVTAGDATVMAGDGVAATARGRTGAGLLVGETALLFWFCVSFL